MVQCNGTRSQQLTWMGCATSHGVSYPRVKHVEHDSAAFRAGLRVGHEILAINDVSLEGRDGSTVQSEFGIGKKNGRAIRLTLLTETD